MKKFMVALALVLLAGAVFYPTEYVDEIEEVSAPIEYDTATYITITAAGDCTLGTDVNYGGSTSFESEILGFCPNSHYLKDLD